MALSGCQADFTSFNLKPLNSLNTLGIADKDSAYNVALIVWLYFFPMRITKVLGKA